MIIKDLKIIDYDISGRGVAKHEGKTLFVENALKNEVCDVQITSQKKNILSGKATAIKKTSENRNNNICCPYYEKCGGCNLQHIKYSEQLKIKQKALKTTIEKFIKKDINVLPCIASEKELAYRNKLDFSVRDGELCFFANLNNQFIGINNCKLADDWNKYAIAAIKNFIKTQQISTYNPSTRTGNLHHVVMRYLNNDLTIVLVLRKKQEINFESLIKNLKNYFQKFSIFININLKTNAEILTNNMHKIYGHDQQVLYEDFLKCSVSPNSFLQVNSEIKNKLYELVLKEINKKNIVINLFSGAGHLTALFAQKAQKVYGIEIVKSAHENANKLAQENNIKNVVNICGDCAIEFPKLIKNLQITQPDVLQNLVVVMDPARSGVSENVLQLLNKIRPTKIAYISCNPATLGRDLSVLNEYEISKLQPFDMFPQTKHLEALAVLKIK